jgi:hypothetical protein
MTDHEFQEARKLIEKGMTVRKAAMTVKIPPSTLRGALKREAAPQVSSEPQPQSEPEPESFLPPGFNEALTKAIDEANRKAEKDRQREKDKWLSQWRRQQGY